MPTYLKPKFDKTKDLVLEEGGSKAQVVWFVDYTDQHTRRVRDALLRSAHRFEEQDISVVIRPVGGTPEDKDAEVSARAAIAADEQGKFPQMHDALFEGDAKYTQEEVVELAHNIGLDIGKFKSDLYSEKTSERLKYFDDSLEASEIYQWPAFFIDGQPFVGVWDEEDIMEALQKPLGYRVRVASVEFVNWAASSSILMVIATIAALFIANVGFHEQYEHFIETIAGLRVGDWQLMAPLEIWVNDGLMAFFFLLVGIEIKHELVAGELSSRDRAAVPVVAALGGMIVPALIYVFINHGNPETSHGWGIPMATDIAFTLGILMLLGDRIPTSLKVFVSALAIVDDLGAIIVIALFYNHGFDLQAFIVAGVIFAVMIALNIFKFYNRLPYLILGVFLWYFVYKSGIHATLAGVLTAFAIPSRRGASAEAVKLHTTKLIEEEIHNDGHVSGETIWQLQSAMERLREPGFFLQQKLQLWCNYFILPVFAFFNTGIIVFGSSFSFGNPEDLGTFLGLVVGKPVGITLAVWLAVRFKFGRLSSEISPSQIVGAGALCGIGFTMSIFIAASTFSGEVLETVKLSILLASVTSAAVGSIVLIKAAPKTQVREGVDEAKLA